MKKIIRIKIIYPRKMPRTPPKDMSINKDFLGCNIPIIIRLINDIKIQAVIKVKKNISISERVLLSIYWSKNGLKISKQFFIK